MVAGGSAGEKGEKDPREPESKKQRIPEGCQKDAPLEIRNLGRTIARYRLIPADAFAGCGIPPGRNLSPQPYRWSFPLCPGTTAGYHLPSLWDVRGTPHSYRFFPSAPE